MGMIFFYALESSGSLQNFQNHDDLTFIGVFAKEKCFLTFGEKEKHGSAIWILHYKSIYINESCSPGYDGKT